jgi:hypothetical protein
MGQEDLYQRRRGQRKKLDSFGYLTVPPGKNFVRGGRAGDFHIQ